MQVFVRTPCGRNIPVQVDSRTSISVLRRRVEQVLGGSLHPQQRFMCQDMELREHDYFAAYDISHGMTIFLTPPRLPSERIFVHTHSGAKFEVMASPREPIHILKRRIQEREGIPVPQQCLCFRGLELLDNWTLLECSVTPNSVLSLTIRPDHKIFIQVFSGAVFPLYVWRTDTILRVKERIAELRGYPVDQQHLQHEWRELSDNTVLANSGLIPGEPLRLTLRTRRPPLHLHIDGGPVGRFSLHMEAGSDVAALQNAIHSQLRIPIPRQHLVLNGREIKPGRSLAEFGAVDQSVIRLVERERELQLVVECSGFAPLILAARHQDTVASVKERIEKRAGVLKQDQRLAFLGRLLDDERTLQECRVSDGAVLFLTTMSRTSDNTTPLHILLPSGDATRIHVPLHATVSDVRLQIQRKEVLVGHCEILVNGKPLHDDQFIEDCDLRPDTVLVVRQKQGEQAPPEVFISYQWDSQKTVKALFNRLTDLGYSCWMDESEMGGGDQLYEKIDRGLRECKVVIACVTPKYTQSVNCRREMGRADNLRRPIVPLLLKETKWLPDGPMAMIFSDLLYIDMYSYPEELRLWDGDQFDRLLEQLNKYTNAKQT